VPLSRLLSTYPTELCSGLSFCWSLLQIWAEVPRASKWYYSIKDISKHPGECSCRVWEHFAYLQRGMRASRSTSKHWWGCLECLGGLCVALRLIETLLMCVCCAWDMLYTVYTVLGECYISCRLYSVYDVLGVCYTWCVLYFGYAVFGVICIQRMYC
jgi:hypothetical protein